METILSQLFNKNRAQEQIIDNLRSELSNLEISDLKSYEEFIINQIQQQNPSDIPRYIEITRSIFEELLKDNNITHKANILMQF